MEFNEAQSAEAARMPAPSPALYAPYAYDEAPKQSKTNKKHKQLMYGLAIVVVLILVYYWHKKRTFAAKGFEIKHAADKKVVPIPCGATDHAKVLSATYKTQRAKDARPVETDVSANLQKALSAQAGNVPYAVSSVALTGTSAPGHLSFRAVCPAGIAAK